MSKLNPRDAPRGYRAVEGIACIECDAHTYTDECPTQKKHPCTPPNRKDGCFVGYKRIKRKVMKRHKKPNLNNPAPGVPSVLDSYGMWWNIRNGHLQCVGDLSYQGGFPCADINDAPQVLQKEGYL